jgi:hypothetical protein
VVDAADEDLRRGEKIGKREEEEDGKKKACTKECSCR